MHKKLPFGHEVSGTLSTKINISFGTATLQFEDMYKHGKLQFGKSTDILK